MKLASITFLLLATLASVADSQIQELRWGEFGCYSNWERNPWIGSEYEFIRRMPDLRDFPKLLEAASNPKMSAKEREIIRSQMRTLSRCDFGGRIRNQDDDAEAEHRGAVANWKDWWDRYGSRLSELLVKDGRQFEGAWKQVAPFIECPKYPILIPKTWSSKISFKSGDYGAILEEIIEFRVDERGYLLRRCYRRPHMKGETDWIWEEWQDFNQEEAERFLASLIYLIDNPWFKADDKMSEDGEFGHIKGRPEIWSNYYPSYSWTGILDDNQHVIINNDPSAWHTIDHKLGPTTSLDYNTFGIVFRLVRDLFPDPSWDDESSRWERVAAPPNEEGEQASSGQPATRSESKLEDSDKPQPEAEGRSR